MAETSSLLNCRRGNSTASSNLVLSACSQPTTQVAGCFVVGRHRACSSVPPQQSNRQIAQQSVANRQRPRGSAQDARANASESCRPRCSRTPSLIPTTDYPKLFGTYTTDELLTHRQLIINLECCVKARLFLICEFS